MKKTLVLMSALLLVAFGLSAAPACLEHTSVLLPQGTPGNNPCSFGGLTFSNFLLTNAGGSPVGTMDLVSFALTGDGVVLNFNPSLTAVTPNPQGGQGVTDEWFYFQVDGGVNGVDLSVGGNQNSTITEKVCLTPIGPNTGNNCTGGDALNRLAFLTVSGGSSGKVMFSDPYFNPNTGWGGAGTAYTGGYVQTIYIYKDILVQGPLQNGTTELSAFSQSFSIPEPMTMALFGSGLLALGLVRRFRRS